MENKIEIVLSTALIEDNLGLKKRIEEYTGCFGIIKKMGYKFTILETVVEKSSFLESHCDNVIYTNVNGCYNNRGTNYINSFKKFVDNSNFDDDCIIIHITGRYPLIDDSFIKECLLLDNKKIGCFKKDKFNQFHLFLYSLRFKHLKELLNSIDVEKMERDMINLEMIFYNNLPHNLLKIIDYLGIIGRQSNETDVNKYGKIKF